MQSGMESVTVRDLRKKGGEVLECQFHCLTMSFADDR